MIYNEDNFDYGSARVGDLVDEMVIDNLINVMPPACMRNECMQIGEPHSHRYDPGTNDYEAVYHTLRRFDGHIWEYCGKCFRGENKERGKDICYVNAV